MSLEVIKDELIKTIRISARAKDYVLFKYATKVLRRFDNRRALDEVMEIIAL
jgi:hypothetical protein